MMAILILSFCDTTDIFFGLLLVFLGSRFGNLFLQEWNKSFIGSNFSFHFGKSRFRFGDT